MKRTEKQAAAAEEATEATAMPSPPARVNKPEARKAPPAKDNKFPLWIVLVGALVVVGGMWMLMSAPAGGKVGGKGPVKKDTVKSGAMLERREKLKGLLKSTFMEGEQAVATKIVRQVLLRNDRQREAKTLTRAVVFLFAGGAFNAYEKMEHVIQKHVLGGSQKGLLELASGEEAFDSGLRGAVAEQLEKNPRSVIILRNVDRADPEILYDLEDAFENQEIQHAGKSIDCRRAVFILETNLNSGGEVSAKAVRAAASGFWSRQAFVARVREAVPFEHNPEEDEMGFGGMGGMEGMEDMMAGGMGGMDGGEGDYGGGDY